MTDDRGEWLVYTIEELHGQRLWLFWSDDLKTWLSDETRATRYTGHAADGTADLLSEEQELEVKIIRFADLV